MLYIAVPFLHTNNISEVTGRLEEMKHIKCTTPVQVKVPTDKQCHCV